MHTYQQKALLFHHAKYSQNQVYDVFVGRPEQEDPRTPYRYSCDTDLSWNVNQLFSASHLVLQRSCCVFIAPALSRRSGPSKHFTKVPGRIFGDFARVRMYARARSCHINWVHFGVANTTDKASWFTAFYTSVYNLTSTYAKMHKIDRSVLRSSFSVSILSPALVYLTSVSVPGMATYTAVCERVGRPLVSNYRSSTDMDILSLCL
jgi:hypothetical protein